MDTDFIPTDDALTFTMNSPDASAFDTSEDPIAQSQRSTGKNLPEMCWSTPSIKIPKIPKRPTGSSASTANKLNATRSGPYPVVRLTPGATHIP